MQKSQAPSVTFPSRRDGWLVLVLTAAIVLELIAAAALIVVGPPSLWLGRILPLLLAAAAAVVAWSLLATSYRVQDGDLVIRSGPFTWRVPIASIDSVASTHSIIAAPALSSDRLELRCKDPERTVQVSPRDPAAFVAALTRVNATVRHIGVSHR